MSLIILACVEEDAWVAFSIRHHLVGQSLLREKAERPFVGKLHQATNTFCLSLSSFFILRHLDILGKGSLFVCVRSAQKIVPRRNGINIPSRTKIK
jgi:hypothetical protein